MPRPSVLHVYKDYYPPVAGGIEKCIHWMAGETRKEFHVRVLVAGRSRRTTDEAIDGVRVVRVGCLGRVLSAPVCPGFAGWLRRLDSDILHFHMPNPTGEMAYLLARPRGAVVATYHSDIVRQRLTGRLYAPLQRRFLARARVVMPTSREYMMSSKTLEPHRERCLAVPLGVPLEDYAETEQSRAAGSKVVERARGKVRIVFLGVLRYYKGLSYLLEAMRGLELRACLFIAGDGPQRAALERQARELGFRDTVVFLGAYSDEQGVGIRRAGDIFCSPSHLRAEAYGLSQIEAMACGLPVVSTDLPWAPAINVDGETGLVVPPADAGALRQALEKLIADPPLRRRMGEAARVRAEAHFSARAMGRVLRRVYHEVLGDKPEPEEK
jgi:rhamnosyl/mannosyltransferase